MLYLGMTASAAACSSKSMSFTIKMSRTPPSDLSKSEVQQKLKSGDLILSDPKSSKSPEEEELLLKVSVETY